MIKDWDDELLQKEYARLIQAGRDRVADIAKRRKDRHDNINFENSNYIRHLADIKQEMNNRGLK